jgi:hypothetical protein
LLSLVVVLEVLETQQMIVVLVAVVLADTVLRFLEKLLVVEQVPKIQSQS